MENEIDSERFFSMISNSLDERMTRLVAGAAAFGMKYGGVSQVARLSGLSRPSIYAGMTELKNENIAFEEGKTRQRKSGGTSSIPLDMAKIGQMLLNKGAYGQMRFMKENTFKQMLPTDLSKVLPVPYTKKYGFGCIYYEELGEGTFGHGAASSATLRIDPENDMIIVMTRNSAGKNFWEYYPKFIKSILSGIKK